MCECFLVLSYYSKLISLWRSRMSTFYGLGSGEEESFNLLSKIETQADYVVRFAYCLTLNISDSEELCKETFGEAIKKGLGFWEVDTRQLRIKLCKITWEKFNHRSFSKERSSYTVTGLLGEMDTRARSSLTLVDAMGVDAREAFNLIGISEEEGRQILARARQQLVNFKF